jgi:hypothetical protein
MDLNYHQGSCFVSNPVYVMRLNPPWNQKNP